jgi:hypothetical protein
LGKEHNYEFPWYLSLPSCYFLFLNGTHLSILFWNIPKSTYFSYSKTTTS